MANFMSGDEGTARSDQKSLAEPGILTNELIVMSNQTIDTISQIGHLFIEGSRRREKGEFGRVVADGRMFISNDGLQVCDDRIKF